MKTLFALLLLVFAASAYSEDKAPEKAKAEPEKAPVVQIKRTGPPPCNVKPVMTDEEIEVCKRAGRAPRQKPAAPELSR